MYVHTVCVYYMYVHICVYVYVLFKSSCALVGMYVYVDTHSYRILLTTTYVFKILR